MNQKFILGLSVLNRFLCIWFQQISAERRKVGTMIKDDFANVRDTQETLRKAWITPAIITGSVVRHSEGTSVRAQYESQTDNLAS